MGGWEVLIEILLHITSDINTNTTARCTKRKPCEEIAICDRRPAPVNNNTQLNTTAQLRKLRFETVAKYKIVTALMSPYNQNQKIPIQTLSDEVETIMVVAINHQQTWLRLHRPEVLVSFT